MKLLTLKNTRLLHAKGVRGLKEVIAAECPADHCACFLSRQLILKAFCMPWQEECRSVLDCTGHASAPREDVDWLKAVAAIVLFFEAMLGVLLPLLRRVSAVESAFQRGLMSALNCFAGGVFITFGMLCLLWAERRIHHHAAIMHQLLHILDP